jgi:hypothetical protein
MATAISGFKCDKYTGKPIACKEKINTRYTLGPGRKFLEEI